MGAARVLAMTYLQSLGIQQVGRLSVPIPICPVTCGGEIIGKFGGSGEVNSVTRTSTGASYFDGTTWQPWRACG